MTIQELMDLSGRLALMTGAAGLIGYVLAVDGGWSVL